MLLFELFATLGLDTTTFRQQADDATAEGEQVAKSVSDSFTSVQTDAYDANQKLVDLETKSGATSAIVDGLVQATAELIQAGV